MLQTSSEDSTVTLAVTSLQPSDNVRVPIIGSLLYIPFIFGCAECTIKTILEYGCKIEIATIAITVIHPFPCSRFFLRSGRTVYHATLLYTRSHKPRIVHTTEHGFALHKGAFHDALALRYGWTPDRLPSNCACGASFSVEHALSCAKGGFPSIRHNEIPDLTATLLTEVCNDVCIEPELQPVTDEQLTDSTANSRTGARLDIAANGVWGGTFERTYFDVRVFNPHAPSNRQTNLQSVYRKHEQIKKRAYEQRIREIEHATFSPLVLSATCGLAKEANTFYKRFASMLASKWDHNYSSTLCWLRCRLAFSLLRSSIQAIRGARSSCEHAIRMSTVVDLINSESRLPSH